MKTSTKLAMHIPPIRRMLERIECLENARKSLLAEKVALEVERANDIVVAPERALGVGDFACTVCRETKALTPFERRTGLENDIFDLWMCLKCNAILNATHLREVAAGFNYAEIQASSSDDFYAVDQEYLAGVPGAIEADTFLSFLLQMYPECPRGVAIDFGAGRGITAGAAAKHFDKVYAAELSLNVLKQVHAVMPLREKIVVTDDYKSIPDRFDAIISTHVLEHLPDLRDVMGHLVEQLNASGAVFFQVPMLLKPHLHCVHYTFFSEASCRALAIELGLEIVGVWYAHDHDFLNCIMRKPA